jgi:BirA family transcriptional regulator, biotin operon repressor / biotin---[acetyl-CoA-carboxylase] ligase
MDEQILKLLREHAPGFISGEKMSRQLGVTRTAIWKRIGALRHSGYTIEASRRLGYRLLQSPDLLSPAEVRPFLKTRWIGKKIHYFQTVDSTNVQAYQLALRGAGEGEIVVAESQEKGRGRLGRHWYSPPFRNLYLSVILRPRIPPHRAPLITLMAAVATAEAIEKTSGLHPMIKWPNDLLIKGRKLAGLLNEIHSETDRVHFVILGMGVNLNTDKGAFSKEIRGIATSLKRETGKAISRKVFLQHLLQALEKWYDVFNQQGGFPVLQAWRNWAQVEGKQVKITSFGEIWTGKAVDVDSDGALILETANGETKRILAGDVQYRAQKQSGVRSKG